MNFLNHSRDCLFDAAFERHRVCTRSNRADAFLKDRLREHRSGRSAVTGNVARFARDFANHLRAHIFERVF